MCEINFFDLGGFNKLFLYALSIGSEVGRPLIVVNNHRNRIRGHRWSFLMTVGKMCFSIYSYKLFCSYKDAIKAPPQRTLLQHLKNQDCSKCFSGIV